MSQAGYPDTEGSKYVVEVKGGLFALKIGIGSQYDFLHSTVLEAVGEFPYPDVTGSYTFGGGDGTMKDMVQTTVYPGMLYGENVLGLLDNTYHRTVSLLVATDRAWVNVSQVTAGGAERNFLLDIAYGIRQKVGLFRIGPQQVIGYALRTFRSDTGQLTQLLD